MKESNIKRPQNHLWLMPTHLMFIRRGSLNFFLSVRYQKMYGVIDYQKNLEFFFQEGVKNCRLLGEQLSSEVHSQHISQWKFEPSSLALNKLHYQNIPKSTNAEFFHKYYQIILFLIYRLFELL